MKNDSSFTEPGFNKNVDLETVSKKYRSRKEYILNQLEILNDHNLFGDQRKKLLNELAVLEAEYDEIMGSEAGSENPSQQSPPDVESGFSIIKIIEVLSVKMKYLKAVLSNLSRRVKAVKHQIIDTLILTFIAFEICIRVSYLLFDAMSIVTLLIIGNFISIVAPFIIASRIMSRRLRKAAVILAVIILTVTSYWYFQIRPQESVNHVLSTLWLFA